MTFHLQRAMILCVGAAVISLTGCGGGSLGTPISSSSYQSQPIANDQYGSTYANVQYDDALDVMNVDWSTSLFYIDTPPSFGTLSLDQYTGNFSYIPYSDFTGTDYFSWDCADQFGDSNIAQVTIDIYAPVVGHLPSAHNIAHTLCARDDTSGISTWPGCPHSDAKPSRLTTSYLRNRYDSDISEKLIDGDHRYFHQVITQSEWMAHHKPNDRVIS